MNTISKCLLLAMIAVCTPWSKTVLLNYLIVGIIALLIRWVLNEEQKEEQAREARAAAAAKREAAAERQRRRERRRELELLAQQVTYRPPGIVAWAARVSSELALDSRSTNKVQPFPEGESSRRPDRPRVDGGERKEELKSSRRNRDLETTHKDRRKRTLEVISDDEGIEHKHASLPKHSSKRDVKRKKHDVEQREKAEDTTMCPPRTTLPGGYAYSDVDEPSRPEYTYPPGSVVLGGRIVASSAFSRCLSHGRRRKRQDAVSEADQEEDNASERNRLHGRAVKHRREEAGNDNEKTLVQSSSRRQQSTRRRDARGDKTHVDKRRATEGGDRASGRIAEDDELAGQRKRRRLSAIGLRATPIGETTTDEEQEEEDSQSNDPKAKRAKLTDRGAERKRVTQHDLGSGRKDKVAAVDPVKKQLAKQTRQTRRWTERNGQVYKISSKDGIRRKLVAVKEWRNKYVMPADSVNPERFTMYRVLVEKWVTDAEEKKLESAKLLGWQSDDAETRNGHQGKSNGIAKVDDTATPAHGEGVLNHSLRNYHDPRYQNQASRPVTWSSTHARPEHELIANPRAYNFPPQGTPRHTALRAHRFLPGLQRSSATSAPRQ